MVILRLMKTQIPFKHQPQKMVKHYQIIRSHTGEELLDCVWPFRGIGA